MMELYIAAFVSITVDCIAGYLTLGIVLAEYKGIFLPLIKYFYQK